MCAVAAEDYQTVKRKLIVIVLHRLHLIQTIFIRVTHILEWHT